MSTNISVSQNTKGWPEPSPNWLESIEKWGWLWHAHIYGFGTLFLVLALYVGFCLVRDRKRTFANHRIHFAALDIMLLVTGLVRSVILFYDPYLSSQTSSNARALLCIISWGVGAACTTSAFTIMLLIFLETTKTSLGPPRLRNLPFLLGVTSVNIIYLITSDLVVWFYHSAKFMIMVCHVTFATWGLVASFGYAVAAYRLKRNLKSSLDTSSHDHVHLIRLFVLMCVASVFGLCNFGLSIYSASSEYGVLDGMASVKYWPWFGVQTASRTLELFLCASVLTVASKNTKSREGQHFPLKVFVRNRRSIDVQDGDIH